jgi:hypothetical protein
LQPLNVQAPWMLVQAGGHLPHIYPCPRLRWRSRAVPWRPAAIGNAAFAARCIVQLGGKMLRIAASELRAEFERSPVSRAIALDYIATMTAQLHNSVLCNALHGEEPTARP